MTARYTTSAARKDDGTIETACQENAPPVVQDLAVLLVDILMEHPGVDGLLLGVEVDS